jgi:hypothetical protein
VAGSKCVSTRGSLALPSVSPGRPNAHPRRSDGGAGVDQAGARIADHGRSFARGGIRQAQERDVGEVQQPGALGRILALVGIDAQQLDVAAPAQVLVDAQARRALLAIDKDGESHRTPAAVRPDNVRTS